MIAKPIAHEHRHIDQAIDMTNEWEHVKKNAIEIEHVGSFRPTWYYPFDRLYRVRVSEDDNESDVYYMVGPGSDVPEDPRPYEVTHVDFAIRHKPQKNKSRPYRIWCWAQDGSSGRLASTSYKSRRTATRGIAIAIAKANTNGRV